MSGRSLPGMIVRLVLLGGLVAIPFDGATAMARSPHLSGASAGVICSPQVRIRVWARRFGFWRRPVKAAGAWMPAASMAVCRDHLAAARGQDGRIYAMGGFNYSGGPAVATVEAYTPGATSWATAAPMPTARGSLAAAAGSDGRIYALGGFAQPGVSLNTVEAYTPGANSWTAVAPMPTARDALAATSGCDGRLYAIGGYTGTPLSRTYTSTVEAYDPVHNTWSTVAPLPSPRGRLAAVTGLDCRIYVLGGSDATGTLATVQVYTPSSNSWTTLASMPTARDRLVAVVGADGRIYAIDGCASANDAVPLNTVQAYTPGTNTWAAVAGTGTARDNPGAALGLDGRIYVMGGFSRYPPMVMSTAESYDTTAGTK